jgi:hypothetical protein
MNTKRGVYMITIGLSCPHCGAHVIDNPENVKCFQCDKAYPEYVLKMINAHSAAKMRLVAKEEDPQRAVAQLAAASRCCVGALEKVGK